MDFVQFRDAVDRQFTLMKSHHLFRVDVDKELLWNTYLNSFTEGSNPMFRERTEHDCSCCKSYIRTVGGVVAIINGQLASVWDVNVGGKYQPVADALAALVKSRPIENVFLHSEPHAGVRTNYERGEGGTVAHTWNHFFMKVPEANYVRGTNLGIRLGKARASYDVFNRALRELTEDSVDTVLDLIAQGSLYRGEENKAILTKFRKAQENFSKLTNEVDRSIFVWSALPKVGDSVAFIRNTSIGTLLVDLSEGKDLEYAVKSFEAKVAPANYKRPTALISKSMIENAQKEIANLGLQSALERRYAMLSDISVNNVIYADRSARKVMEGDVFSEMVASTSATPKTLDKVEEVPIEDFINNILPKAESVEVLLENRHESNLVSLISPMHSEAKPLFKWNNGFSWSYNGDVADSIKERVKAAGGRIAGELCCRLAWDYKDDLDFWMTEPNGYRIYFGNRRTLSPCGGILDVDANGADGIREDPVENIVYESRSRLKEGNYVLQVHNYCRRSDGSGFTVEMEFDGNVIQIPYGQVLANNKILEVAAINYSKKDGFKIVRSMPSSQTTKQIWGLNTQNFHKVAVVMNSPNYWDEQKVGNKHYFFMLEGCKNEGKARGFYNEFLIEDLSKHRKVMEIVGSKTKVKEASEQLSGIGFSSTQRNHVLCRVKGSFNRVIKVVI